MFHDVYAIGETRDDVLSRFVRATELHLEELRKKRSRAEISDKPRDRYDHRRYRLANDMYDYVATIFRTEFARAA